MENLILGDPLDKNTDIGAINSKPQLEKIQMYLDIGVDEGSKIYQSTCAIPKKGFWCAPTLFTDMSQSHRLVPEEIFGPVLVIQTFRTIDEVIAKANNTPYGLSGGVWQIKDQKFSKKSKDIRAGVIWAKHSISLIQLLPLEVIKKVGWAVKGLEGLLPYVSSINNPR
ncbi:MAG: hypothetical protein CM1200mP10_20310 [Candidatus Neomarinimicrobiota bacterium]|nr:MAG: hypothetical protein CM1200mP10_20310 [Candidatus Neomarinimicrobiota bacterium]